MKLRIPSHLHFEVVPSPGTQIHDWDTMKEKLELLKPFAKTVHIDLADGKFVNNTTFMDPAPFKEFANDFILEAHFMTENPIQYLKPFADAGFKRFVGQVEKMPDIAEFVAQGQLLGEVGLAIDGPTSLKDLDIPLDDLDVVLFYTGEKAGFSGATMRPDRLQKVSMLRERDPFIPIEIDGGVNDKNILDAKSAGVTRFVTTGYIYSSPDPKKAYETLHNLISEA